MVPAALIAGVVKPTAKILIAYLIGSIIQEWPIPRESQGQILALDEARFLAQQSVNVPSNLQALSTVYHIWL